ncbi:hypothetical protein Vretimale_15909 [Volvox reticuliferus]|uniref:Uncharacterized protein n=1 Tax=Volvox reticuliferus TaxID=1737510 RepID=A0A8J4GSZ7_9CHLO|nr:hypothetical protein Vretifemale_9775 [Volvox reticuliferus]GIM12739.1 hypothetical protein Vretimale_15909 [Volvox reticuliferus]
MTTTRRSSAAAAAQITTDTEETFNSRRISARLADKAAAIAAKGKNTNAKKACGSSEAKLCKGSKRAREKENPQPEDEVKAKQQRGRPRKSVAETGSASHETSVPVAAPEQSVHPNGSPPKKRSRPSACPSQTGNAVEPDASAPLADVTISGSDIAPAGGILGITAQTKTVSNAGQTAVAPVIKADPPAVAAHQLQPHRTSTSSAEPMLKSALAAAPGAAPGSPAAAGVRQPQPLLFASSQRPGFGAASASIAVAGACPDAAAVAAGSPRAALKPMPNAESNTSGATAFEPAVKLTSVLASGPNGALSEEEIIQIRNLLMPGALAVKTSCAAAADATADKGGDRIDTGGSAEAAKCSSAAEPTCRTNQFNELYGMVSDCCSTGRSSAAYISGLPGTGKSYTVSRILAALPAIASTSKGGGGVSFCCVTVNCMALDDPVQLYGRMHIELLRAVVAAESAGNDVPDVCTPTDVNAAHESLLLTLTKLSIVRPAAAKGGKGTKGKTKGSNRGRSDAAVSDTVAPLRRVFVVVLDEVDRLLRRRDGAEEMARLFQLPATRGVSMVLLAVANSLDLTERMIPLLRGTSGLGVTPRHLVFTAYSRPQILSILSTQLGAHPRGRLCFDGGALDMVAKSVSSSCGDFRQALKACRIALDVLMEHNRANPAATRASVGIREVHAALQRLSGQNNGQQAMVAKIKGLPPQQQLVLLALATAVGAKAAATGADAGAGAAVGGANTFQPGNVLFTGSRPKFADAVAFREIGNVPGAAVNNNPGACFDGPTPSKPPRPGAIAATTPSTNRVLGMTGPGGGGGVAATPSSCGRGPSSRTPGSFMAGDAGLALGLAEVYSQYGALCRQLDIPAMSDAAFRIEALRGLTCDGLIRVTEGRTPAAMRLSLRSSVRDVQTALADNVMFKRLMGAKAPPVGTAAATAGLGATLAMRA